MTIEVQSILTLGAIAGALFAIWKLVAPLLHHVRNINEWQDNFRRDWEGEEATPGRDAVPGVMQRLNKLDGEFRRNGGGSLKDQVDRLEDQIQDLNVNVDKIAVTQQAILDKLAEKDLWKRAI